MMQEKREKVDNSKFLEIGIPEVFQKYPDIIAKLPEFEREMLGMFFIQKKGQREIAEHFKVTQGSISSRIKRAKNRIYALFNKPCVNFGEMATDLKDFLGPLEMEIIQLMTENTCQEETARIISGRHTEWKNPISQTSVRNILEKCRMRVENAVKEKPDFSIYHSLLVWIKENPYILHEMKSYRRKVSQ